MVEGSNSCWVILQTTLWQRLQRLRIKLARFLPWCYAMTSGKRFEVVKSSFITIFINSGKVAIETNGSLNWISICFHIIIMNKMAYCSFGSCFQLFFFVCMELNTNEEIFFWIFQTYFIFYVINGYGYKFIYIFFKVRVINRSKMSWI